MGLTYLRSPGVRRLRQARQRLWPRVLRRAAASEPSCRSRAPYQPLICASACTLVLLAAFVRQRTKTDLTLGRSVALLALPHPKCPFQVEHRRVRAFLTSPPSTGVLRSPPHYRYSLAHRSIRQSTYLQHFKRRRVHAYLSPHGLRIVLVLLGRGRMSTREAI